MSDARVVIVGGGITGLAAALELARTAPYTEIVVCEAEPRLGGHLRTSPFAGRPAIDEAADAFLARVPFATELAQSVGLGDELVSPAAGSAAIWRGRLHPIPEGIVLGVPGDVRAMATSDLLSWRGKARAALDLVAPRRDAQDSVGGLVRARFGAEVHDRLVDALVGSIYAADTDRFSLDMVPQLATLAASDRSLLLAAHRSRRRAAGASPTGPVFRAPAGGMGALVEAVAAAARTAGVRIETGAPVTDIVEDRVVGSDGTRAGRWRVDDHVADAVIVAAPAYKAAGMLGQDDDLLSLLSRIETAGVALVTMSVPSGGWPGRLRERSGYLVPKSVQRRVTAVSFGSQKWAHWANGDSEILRVSIGRDGVPFDDLDDDGLITAAVDEVSEHIGVQLQPTATRVSRWPTAFPQYRPGHGRWLDHLEAHTPPGLVLAGASYRGIGIPACIDQGQRAAQTVATHLGRLPTCQS